MSVLEWKQVDLIDFANSPYKKLQNFNAEITAHCSRANTNAFVFCDKNGYIHVFFNNWESITFKSLHSSAKQTIKLCSITANFLLTTVSQEENYSTCIQVYDLRKLNKRQGAPCIANVVVAAFSDVSAIQAETIDDKTFILAIGLEKSEFLLHYGPINRERGLSINIRRHSIGVRPVVGIEFEFRRQQLESHSCKIFISCTDVVYCFTLNDKGDIASKLTLDNKENVHTHGCTMHKPKELDYSYFVVGRDKAVYCFSHDERGPCYIIEGKKKILSWVGNHLVIAIQTQNKAFPTVNSCNLIIVDIENKMIVFNRQVEDVLCVINVNGVYYFITKPSNNTSTYNLYQLKEYDITKKVQLLVKQYMYEAALRILVREGFEDSSDAAYVHYQFGNYFLLKGDVNRAVKEYEQTIGVIKPYNIISKLLGMRHNNHLIQYLELLVASKEATLEHKKLLQSITDRSNLTEKVQKLCDTLNNSSSYDDYGLETEAIEIQSANYENELLKTIEKTKEKDSGLIASSCEGVDLQNFIDGLNKSNLSTAGLLGKNPTPLLLILHTICNRDNIKVSDLRPFFMEKTMQSLMDPNQEQQTIKKLSADINKIGNLLAEFKLNPIEFRNSTCDICHQPLTYPSVYFLCQHSYHKVCLSLNFSTCYICSRNETSFESPYNEKSNNLKSNDIVLDISKIVASGILNREIPNLQGTSSASNTVSKSTEWQGRFVDREPPAPNPLNPFESQVTNPFDDEYDANSNFYRK